jgi:hypothetical protein
MFCLEHLGDLIEEQEGTLVCNLCEIANDLDNK